MLAVGGWPSRIAKLALAGASATLLVACGADQYSASEYPSPGALRYSWNTDSHDSFHVPEWKHIGGNIQMAPIGSTGSRLHYNAEDKAFGVLGPDAREHGLLCGMLFDMFAHDGEAAAILNSLGAQWTGSGDLSLVRHQLKYRIFKVYPESTELTCNVSPAPGKQDSVQGAPICEKNTNGQDGCLWVLEGGASAPRAQQDGRPQSMANTPAEAGPRPQDMPAETLRSARMPSSSRADAGREESEDALTEGEAADAYNAAAEAAIEAERAARRARLDENSQTQAQRIAEQRRLADAQWAEEEELRQRESQKSREEADALLRMQKEHAETIDAEDSLR